MPLWHLHEHHRRGASRGQIDGLGRSEMSFIADRTLSRRTFLKAGGALVVMGAVPIELRATLAEAIAAGTPFPALDPTALASWLAVKADGSVIARSGHVELGHGVQTGFAQIIAEE